MKRVVLPLILGVRLILLRYDTGKTRLYLFLLAKKKNITEKLAGGAALMMTVSYTAKKKQR